jgi:hypothetical protein
MNLRPISLDFMIDTFLIICIIEKFFKDSNHVFAIRCVDLVKSPDVVLNKPREDYIHRFYSCKGAIQGDFL